MRHARVPLAASGLLALGLLLAGCGPKLVVEHVFERDGVRIELRRVQQRGEVVKRGFEHPTTVSDVRIAHILASLNYKGKDGKTAPAIRSLHVYPLAEGLRLAFSKAGPDDEVLALSHNVDRNFGIFSRHVVTAMRLAFLADGLRVEFFEIEDPLDGREAADEKKYTFPREPSEGHPGFRLIPGHGQLVDHTRALLVAWRDPYYARPVNLTLRGGEVRRRTILLESEAQEDVPDPPAVDVTQRDATLRALDELDAARRAGLVTEREFRRRRRLIVEGKLEEAGYEAP